MLKKLFLLAVLLTASCASSNTLRVKLHIPFQDPSPAVREQYEGAVIEGAAALGYSVDFVTWERGAVSLELMNSSSGDFGGRALVTEGCYRAAWAQADVWIIAHELGHTIGLDHSSDPDNIMFPSKSEGNAGFELTQIQQNVADFNASKLHRCR